MLLSLSVSVSRFSRKSPVGNCPFRHSRELRLPAIFLGGGRDLVKRIVCLFLSVSVAVSLFVVPAQASAVGTIVAGAGGAAGLGLTASSVVPVIGAAFGIGIVAYANKDEICRDIKDTIDYIARGYGIADAYLDEFWGKCWDGIVDTSSDVWGAVTAWADGVYKKFFDTATGDFTSASGFFSVSGPTVVASPTCKLTGLTTDSNGYIFTALGHFSDGSVTRYPIVATKSRFESSGIRAYIELTKNGEVHTSSQGFSLNSEDGSWVINSFFGSNIDVYNEQFCRGVLDVGNVDKLSVSQFYDRVLNVLNGGSVSVDSDFSSIGPFNKLYTDNPDLFGTKVGDPIGPDVVSPGRYGVNKKDGALDLHGLAGDYGGTYTGGKTWDGAGGALDSALKDLLTGGLSWDQFMERIGAVPHIATDVPLVDADGKVLTDEAGKVLTKEKDVAIEGDKVTDKDITDTINPPKDDPNPETGGGDSAPYVVDLRDFFPFCIPFDVCDMLAILAAEPVAPKVDWVFNFGKFGSYTFAVDLAKFDTVARLLRDFELLAFCIGLAMATKKLILNGGAG